MKLQSIPKPEGYDRICFECGGKVVQVVWSDDARTRVAELWCEAHQRTGQESEMWAWPIDDVEDEQ